MKTRLTIYSVTETHFLISAKKYPEAGSVTVMFFDGEWWVSHAKWADDFLYTSKTKAMARAKEMMESEIDDIKFGK